MVDAAASAAEVQSKFDVVFGKELRVEMNKTADAIAGSMSRSRLETKQFMAQLQDLFVPLGFTREAGAQLSQTLTLLAYDVASFSERVDADVIQKFSSATVGMSRAVLDLGINVRKTEIAQIAANAGLAKNSKDLTENHAVLIRVVKMLSDSRDAVGDLIATKHTWRNQMKQIRSSLIDLKVILGQSIVKVLQRLIAAMGGAEEIVRMVGLAFGFAREAIIGYLEKMPAVVDSVNKWIESAGGADEMGKIFRQFGGQMARVTGVVIQALGATMLAFKTLLEWVTNFGKADVDLDTIVDPKRFQENMKGVTEDLGAVWGELGLLTTQSDKASEAVDWVAHNMERLGEVQRRQAYWWDQYNIVISDSGREFLDYIVRLANTAEGLGLLTDEMANARSEAEGMLAPLTETFMKSSDWAHSVESPLEGGFFGMLYGNSLAWVEGLNRVGHAGTDQFTELYEVTKTWLESVKSGELESVRYAMSLLSTTIKEMGVEVKTLQEIFDGVPGGGTGADPEEMSDVSEELKRQRGLVSALASSFNTMTMEGKFTSAQVMTFAREMMALSKTLSPKFAAVIEKTYVNTWLSLARTMRISELEAVEMAAASELMGRAMETYMVNPLKDAMKWFKDFVRTAKQASWKKQASDLEKYGNAIGVPVAGLERLTQNLDLARRGQKLFKDASDKTKNAIKAGGKAFSTLSGELLKAEPNVQAVRDAYARLAIVDPMLRRLGASTRDVGAALETLLLAADDEDAWQAQSESVRELIERLQHLNSSLGNYTESVGQMGESTGAVDGLVDATNDLQFTWEGINAISYDTLQQWENMKDALEDIGEMLLNQVLGKFSEGITEVFLGDFNDGIAMMSNTIKAALNAPGRILQGMSGLLSKMFAGNIPIISTLGKGLKAAFGPLGDWISEGLTMIKKFFMELFGLEATQAGITAGQVAASVAAANLLTKAWSKAATAAAIATLGGALTFGAKAIAMIQAAGLPAEEMAEGGIVTGPTLALIGEGPSPEAVVPLDRMDEFMPEFGGGMGGGITVNIYADVVEESFIDQVGELVSAEVENAMAFGA